MSDTVGFVRHLPHQLVEAFRSTLEEVADSDLVLHVVDGSHPDPEGQLAAVREVFAEIGADKVPELVVINKADAADPMVISRLQAARAALRRGLRQDRRGHRRRAARRRGRPAAPGRAVRRAAALRARRPAQPDPRQRRGRVHRAHRRRVRGCAVACTPTWPASSSPTWSRRSRACPTTSATGRGAPYVGDEREVLDGWLDFHRATLLMKCEGLTFEQLKSRPIADHRPEPARTGAAHDRGRAGLVPAVPGRAGHRALLHRGRPRRRLRRRRRRRRGRRPGRGSARRSTRSATCCSTARSTRSRSTAGRPTTCAGS